MPKPGDGLRVAAFARGWTIRASSRAAERRRAGRRDQRPEAAGGRQGHPRLGAGVVQGGPARQVPSANRITLLRDADHDGEAETRTVLLQGLNSPFGMALVGDDALRRQHRRRCCASPTRRARPASPRRARRSPTCPAGRSTITGPRTSSPAPDGTQALCRPSAPTATSPRTAWRPRNEPRRGLGGRPRRPAQRRIFASGLRNPDGLAWEPQTRALWTAVNERDELGSDLVPDYMTAVKDGGFYGWPWSYYGQHVDSASAAAPGDGGQGDRARLRARPAYRLARPGLRPAAGAAAGALPRRRLRRPARLVEPQAALRLQGDLRALRRTAGRAARRSMC